MQLVMGYIHFSGIGFKVSQAKYRGRVVNTPGAYSKGPGFKYRSGDRLFSLQFFRGFPQSIQANARIGL
jgi:hypothetical protein